MSKAKEPLKTFVTRMFTLALVTFFLISFCTPLTYLCLARKGKQAEAAALAHQIACETQAIIDPHLVWENCTYMLIAAHA